MDPAHEELRVCASNWHAWHASNLFLSAFGVPNLSAMGPVIFEIWNRYPARGTCKVGPNWLAHGILLGGSYRCTTFERNRLSCCRDLGTTLQATLTRVYLFLMQVAHALGVPTCIGNSSILGIKGMTVPYTKRPQVNLSNGCEDLSFRRAWARTVAVLSYAYFFSILRKISLALSLYLILVRVT